MRDRQRGSVELSFFGVGGHRPPASAASRRIGQQKALAKLPWRVAAPAGAVFFVAKNFFSVFLIKNPLQKIKSHV